MPYLSAFLIPLVLSILSTANSSDNTIVDTEFSAPVPTNAVTSSKQCLSMDTIAFQAFLATHITREVETIVEVTKSFQTILSYGNTTLYTPSDSIARIRFLGTPTRYETKNVTVTQTAKHYYDPETAASSLKMVHTVPCNKEGVGVDWILETGFKEQPPCPDAVRSTWEKNFNRNLDSTGRSQNLSSGKCMTFEKCDIHLSEEILVMYWPPDLKQGNSSLPAHHPNISVIQRQVSTLASEPLVTASTSALTFKGRDLHYLGGIDSYHHQTTSINITYTSSSVFEGPFLFTSPHVYVAHRAITISVEDTLVFSTKGNEKFRQFTNTWTSIVRNASIFPVPASYVFTVAPNLGPASGVEYARQVARGEFQPFLHVGNLKLGSDYVGDITTRTFDFHDLEYPIPARVYFDARAGDCWGKQSHCQTITEDNYRPRISLHQTVWRSIYRDILSLIPKDLNCEQPDLVDPPIVLRPLGSTHLEDPQRPHADGNEAPAMTPPSAPLFPPDDGSIAQPPAPGSAPRVPHARPTPQGNNPLLIKPSYRKRPSGSSEYDPGRGDGDPTQPTRESADESRPLTGNRFSPGTDGHNRYSRIVDTGKKDGRKNSQPKSGGGQGDGKSDQDTGGSRTNPGVFAGGTRRVLGGEFSTVLILGFCFLLIIIL